MESKGLGKIIAKNLKFFMALPGCSYRNPNALGVKASVAPNTVRNLLEPSRRTTTTSKPDGFPTIDKLDRIAKALGRDVWELLHPDIERELRGREMYKRLQETIDGLKKEVETSAQK